MVMKRVSLAIDEETLKVGMAYARQHNITFNIMVRELIQQAVKSDSSEWLDEAFSLMDRLNVSSDDRIWLREDLNRV